MFFDFIFDCFANSFFINKPDLSSDLPFISSFEIVIVHTLAPNISSWIAASVVDPAAVNPNSIDTLLANSLSPFPIKDNPVFDNGAKSLTRNTPDGPILCDWVFDTFILAHEPFAIYEAWELVY